MQGSAKLRSPSHRYDTSAMVLSLALAATQHNGGLAAAARTHDEVTMIAINAGGRSQSVGTTIYEMDRCAKDTRRTFLCEM